jgi:hypothetical protein
VTLPIDLTKPEQPTRTFTVTFTTDSANVDWLMGMENETGLSRSLLMHRVLTAARLNVGIATVEGERRQGERRSA